MIGPRTKPARGPGHAVAGEQVQVTLAGGTGRWHQLEASTNLLHWVTVANLYQSNGSSAWTDSGSTNFPQRYYRSRDLSTALDRYVAAPDTNFTYAVVNTTPGAGQTTYVLDLTSQQVLARLHILPISTPGEKSSVQVSQFGIKKRTRG